LKRSVAEAHRKAKKKLNALRRKVRSKEASWLMIRRAPRNDMLDVRCS